MLRSIVLGVLVSLAATTIHSQEAKPPLDFAPGAQGGIAPPIGTMLDEARRLGKAWQESLDIQESDSFDRTFDVDAMRDRALNNPRVRALLDTGDGSSANGEDMQARYGNKQIFLLASFSMPPNVLRVMMIEAKQHNIPIVFRGFLNNSVFDTQAALQSVFGDDADTVGFGIDPTVYTRFNVTTVPQVIVTVEPLDVCETQGCELDPVPAHDVVRGNIPLNAALEIIATGEGEASDVALQALMAVGAKN